jgi:hypothetical protein
MPIELIEGAQEPLPQIDYSQIVELVNARINN